jgi:hypothetical protein
VSYYAAYVSTLMGKRLAQMPRVNATLTQMSDTILVSLLALWLTELGRALPSCCDLGLCLTEVGPKTKIRA